MKSANVSANSHVQGNMLSERVSREKVDGNVGGKAASTADSVVKWLLESVKCFKSVMAAKVSASTYEISLKSR